MYYKKVVAAVYFFGGSIENLFHFSFIDDTSTISGKEAIICQI